MAPPQPGLTSAKGWALPRRTPQPACSRRCATSAGRFGRCAGTPCRCAFVDRSRNRTRRYCCSTLCADRVAQAHYRARKKARPAPEAEAGRPGRSVYVSPSQVAGNWLGSCCPVDFTMLSGVKTSWGSGDDTRACRHRRRSIPWPGRGQMAVVAVDRHRHGAVAVRLDDEWSGQHGGQRLAAGRVGVGDVEVDRPGDVLPAREDAPGGASLGVVSNGTGVVPGPAATVVMVRFDVAPSLPADQLRRRGDVAYLPQARSRPPPRMPLFSSSPPVSYLSLMTLTRCVRG